MLKHIQRFARPLYARDVDETHRVSTELELFFDLVVVIALATVAQQFHHALAEGDIAEGVINFLIAFFLVWLPWNLFTWFASSFDNDDPAYRVTVMVMMAGSMIVAATLHESFATHNFTYTFVGYLIMRLALIIMWYRAGLHNEKMRAMAQRYVFGQLLVQVYWGIVVFVIQPVETSLYALFAVGFVMELFIPWYAEKAHGTTWHRHHIIERFGLLNIIVLGELLFGATMALKSGLSIDHIDWPLVGNSLCGIVVAFCLWWLYFSEDEHAPTTNICGPFYWAYGHVMVFAAGIATGAGLEALNSALEHHEAGEHMISPYIASCAFALPVSLYIIGLWIVREKKRLKRSHGYLLLALALLIGISPAITHSAYLAVGLTVLCVLVMQFVTSKPQAE